MYDVDAVIFTNVIDKLKIANETCRDIEGYEISCALLGINPNAVSQSRLNNVDFELSN